jgi:hypothetical protein
MIDQLDLRRFRPRGVTLIDNCKLTDVDPQAWLADILARLPDHSVRRIDELLPRNWKRPREQPQSLRLHWRLNPGPSTRPRLSRNHLDAHVFLA